MPDAAWIALVFVVGPLTLVLGLRALVGARARRFSSEGAVAEAFISDDGAYELVAPAGGPLMVCVEYSIRATRRGGGGIAYGLVLRLDVERAGDVPFVQRGEYLIGQAQRLFGEVEERDSLDAGPLVRTGLDLRRVLVLARVPAGGELRVRGKVERRTGESFGLHVYARPPGS